MKHFSVLFAGLLSSFLAHSEDSCAVQAAKLMAQGKLTELSGMFAGQRDAASVSLEQLASTIESVEQVHPLPKPLEGKFVRRSVFVASLPESYKFKGSWASVVSQTGVRYQVQASSEPNSACRLLGLHVDRPAK